MPTSASGLTHTDSQMISMVCSDVPWFLKKRPKRTKTKKLTWPVIHHLYCSPNWEKIRVATRWNDCTKSLCSSFRSFPRSCARARSCQVLAIAHHSTATCYSWMFTHILKGSWKYRERLRSSKNIQKPFQPWSNSPDMSSWGPHLNAESKRSVRPTCDVKYPSRGD